MMTEYPNEPGWKGRDTSREAAAGVGSKASTVRELVLECITANALTHGLTADECATMLSLHYGTVRPRCSELSRMGKIQDSGLRRPNVNGKRCVVWESVQ